MNMEYRKINATFLEELIKFRFALSTIRAVLKTDEVLAALTHTGFSPEAIEETTRELAQPPLLKLLDELRACLIRQFPHGEQQVIISTLIHSIKHALENLTDKGQPDFIRRLATKHKVEAAWNLVGVAIRSEIGVDAEKIAVYAEQAKHRTAKR